VENTDANGRATRQEAAIWKLPRAFAWILPGGAAWVFVLIYVIMHVFLGVPLSGIVSPYLAFAALTLAMGVGVFWAARYGAHIESRTPVLWVVAAYGLVCFPLWAHFALSLGIGRPKAVVSGAWLGEGIWCVTSISAILKNRVKARR